MMNAMVLNQMDSLASNPVPLTLQRVLVPIPGKADLLLRVSVRGVCHTDLDEIEGGLLPSQLPIILGYQVVGIVQEMGAVVSGFQVGDRVGVAWLFSACGACEFYRSNRVIYKGHVENLTAFSFCSVC